MLKWGLLGTAHINRRIIPAMRTSSRSLVHAVASREGARAGAYASEWKIPHAHASYDALLASDVDIVYIALPNSLHAHWTLRALSAGRHVLCEKPLALTPADVDRVAQSAHAHGLVVAEGLMYRHMAQTRRVADIIAAGEIGHVQSIMGGFTHPQARGDADPRVDPALGGGALWDVGCYPVSFAHLVAGAPPASVTGVARMGPTGVDHAFAATIAYANGVTAQCHAGFRMAYHTSMRIVGTTGVLDIPHPFSPGPLDAFTIVRDHAAERVEVGGSAIFEDEIADMEDAVLGLRPQRVTLDESRRLAETLSALYRSSRDHQTVALR